MQLTENDKSTGIPDEIPDDFLIPEEEYDKMTGGPAHAPQPVPHDPLVEQIHALLKQANVPKETLSSVRDAVQKELNDVIAKKA